MRAGFLKLFIGHGILLLILFFQNCSGGGFSFTSSSLSPEDMASASSAPVVSILAAPQSLTNARTFDFKFNVSTNKFASVKSVTCVLDANPAQSCDLGFNATNLMDGDHTLKVKVVDSLGNASDEVVVLWKVDGTKPVVTINQSPSAVSGTTSLNFAFSSNEVVSFLCAMDAEAMAPCTSPVARTVTEGNHTFKVQSVDMASNMSDVVMSTFKVDLTAPVITLVTKPTSPINSNAASFTFNGTDDGKAITVFSCKLDNQAAAACNAGSVNYTGLAEGSHTLSLSGQDAAGNMSAAVTYTWSVDTMAPSVPVITANITSPTKNNAATFSFSAMDLNGVKSYECQLDAGAITACAATGASYMSLASGAHSFKVRAIDAVNNVSAFASFAWTVDLTAPVVTLTQTPASSTSATSASFAFTATDTGSSVKSIECQLDAGVFAVCTSPKDYTALATGAHSFNVRVKDQVDNTTTQSYNWSIVAAATPTPTPTLPPLPTPVPAGATITNIQVTNLDSTTKSKVKFTFAMPFKQGDVPSNYSVTLVPIIPLQVDKKATHSDGSLRHAIFTGEVDLAAGETKTFAVQAAQVAASTQTVQLQDLINSGYDFNINLNIGGTSYSLSAKALLQSGAAKLWLSGPLVSEWIIGSDFLNGATAHPSLAGYFHVRAYYDMNVRTDVVVENGWFERQKSASANKDISYTVTAGSYSAALNHYVGARWHKQFWNAQNPNVYVKLGKNYLQGNRFFPRYKNMTANVASISAAAQTFTPMKGGDFGASSCDMGGTGDNIWIGPLPIWDSFYAVSTDVKAFNYMLAQNDSAGVFGCLGRYINSGVCVHMRDKTTGLPASIDTYPNASAGDPAVDKIPDPQTSNPFIKDTAHQPLVGYSPYLVTGDYYQMEEMVFWNGYNLLEPSPGSRKQSQGLWSTDSVRAMGWSYRSLGYAAYILPDAHPLKAYFKAKLLNNLARDKAYADANASNPFGTLFMSEGNTQYRSFFDDFFTWSIGNVADLGFSEAIPILAYKSRFPIGRMGGANGGDNGYCFQAAPAYTHPVGPTNSTLYTSWAQVYNAAVPNCPITATRPCGSAAMSSCLGIGSDPYSMTAAGTNTAYYYAEMQPALAVSVQYGYGTITDHWFRFTGAKTLPTYENDPRFGVIPRNAP
ncbi:MAG: hypothetical protein IPM97_14480 [Bdellovibrionaceae bacterium]|nr:hypothetical protein [Pseudobdellovibrionaceae bacterium]